MRESVAIIERLHATAHLLNNAIGLNCVIVGPEKEIALEMPPNHIGSCFCKRLEELTGETEDLDHFYARCDYSARGTESGSYAVYHCPYGLANIIIPAFDGNQFVAALQIGPIRTSEPDQLLLNQGLLLQGVNGEKIETINKFLDQLRGRRHHRRGPGIQIAEHGNGHRQRQGRSRAFGRYRLLHPRVHRRQLHEQRHVARHGGKARIRASFIY